MGKKFTHKQTPGNGSKIEGAIEEGDLTVWFPKNEHTYDSSSYMYPKHPPDAQYSQPPPTHGRFDATRAKYQISQATQTPETSWQKIEPQSRK